MRVNERIRVREIRVIDDTGAQLGIMPPPQALAIAKQKGLDLVEISPTASPPVCRIMDFGKYQYQEQKRAREARRHQKVIEVKEIKFRPKVDERQEKIGYKIREAQLQKVPFMLVVGDREVADGTVSVRERAGGDRGSSTIEAFIAAAMNEIAHKGDRQDANRSGATATVST